MPLPWAVLHRALSYTSLSMISMLDDSMAEMPASGMPEMSLPARRTWCERRIDSPTPNDRDSSNPCPVTVRPDTSV